MENQNGIQAPTHPEQILLVDDDPGVLFGLKLLIQAIGYRVTGFSTPAQALEFLQQNNSCDLFICDLRMPQMDGFAVLAETRKLRPDVPFVLMSGHANSADQEKAQALGGAGFLAKPFVPDQLHELVQRLRATR